MRVIKLAEFAEHANAFAKATELNAEAALFFKANAELVWKLPGTLRGNVIERAEAILKFRLEEFDWIGIARKGRFPGIDFINFARGEQVSLKTIYRASGEWASAISEMKQHLNDLAGVTKVWNKELGEVDKLWHEWPSRDLSAECRAALKQWHRVLEIRVPKGSERQLDELVKYGREIGVEVRVSAF